MTPPEPKPLPCPFCGSENGPRLEPGGIASSFIRCKDCRAQGPKHANIELAEAWWNRRSGSARAEAFNPPDAAFVALSHYMQADEDGIMVTASRQAIDEVVAWYARFVAALAAGKDEGGEKEGA